MGCRRRIKGAFQDDSLPKEQMPPWKRVLFFLIDLFGSSATVKVDDEVVAYIALSRGLTLPFVYYVTRAKDDTSDHENGELPNDRPSKAQGN